MEPQELLEAAAREMGIEVKDRPAVSEQLLTDRINEMLQNDFSRLVALLYRIDVNEDRLRELLKVQPGRDAAVIITRLILERQLQKINSRQRYRMDNSGIGEDEKW